MVESIKSFTARPNGILRGGVGAQNRRRRSTLGCAKIDQHAAPHFISLFFTLRTQNLFLHFLTSFVQFKFVQFAFDHTVQQRDLTGGF